ncbi:MAG: helix-turn-helix transcriptional regulator [Clostridia bacterium]|nr:helix-turn-helix transcriptional regulator [Clostridia bacterium]
MSRTGENIRTLRLARGLTVRDLQQALGFGTPQAIYKWQQGVTLPTLDNLVILSDILGVSMEAILAVDSRRM